MSIVILLKKAQQGDKSAMLEIVKRYRGLLKKNCYIHNQTVEEHKEFYSYLIVTLIEAIHRFDFEYTSKNKKNS